MAAKIESFDSGTSSFRSSASDGTGYGSSASCLVNVLHTITEKTVSSVRFREFIKNFRPLHEKYPDQLKVLHTEFKRQLKENIEKEIELMLKEETDLIACLNNLDEMKNLPGDLITWRPTGCPRRDLLDQLCPMKMKYIEQLKTVLENRRVKINELRQKVLVNHERLHQLQDAIVKESEWLEETAQSMDILLNFDEDICMHPKMSSDDISDTD